MVSKEDLARAFEQQDQQQHLNGAVLVSQNGGVLFEKAYGLASHQLSVPNTLETRFHIASMTKMFTAMAALILSEQGRISLQAKPAIYLPELSALDEDITIHHLLSHASGIQDIYDIPDLSFEMSKLEHEQRELLSYLVNLPQTFPPGSGWSYSSTGYILMGYLMQQVTGLTFAELMKRYVLAPLSLMSTGLDKPRRINPGRAYGRTMADGQLVNAANDKLSMFEDAPGELYSTVRDLKKWCDAMFDCPLVAPETLRLMLTPYGQVSPTLQYGYGWFLSSRYRMHGGVTPGFIAHIRQYPEQKVNFILLVNADNVDLNAVLSAVEPLLVG